jgi:metallo-beta-lactamase family protein
MTRIHFWGAAETVTGSKYLVETSDQKILVDCGMFQGLKKLRQRNWQPLPMPPNGIDAVVLTHAHIDHTGYLPRLVKDGFRGTIYCTRATYDLAQILLRDAAYLQEEDARRANKYGYTKHNPAQPLFGEDDVELTLELFEPVEFCAGDEQYSARVELGDGIRCGFHPAGHILGAAWIAMEIDGKRLVFSGDIGRPNDPVMRPARPLDRADLLVLESTYGNRRHADDDISEQMAEVINRTAERGGIVLVPAFAVGRSQGLMHLIAELKADQKIPDLPIFLNSPMAINASNLYWSRHDLHRLSEQRCRQMGHNVTYVRSPEESRALNKRTEPAIIISASGMVTGGRILHHVKAFGPDSKNTILFCGYQAAGTRGEALVHGVDKVKIHGKYVPIRAEVVSLDGMSAHADYVELGDWLETLDEAPAQVFLTHGEPVAQDAFRRYLNERFGWEVEIPELEDVVELE